MEDHHSMMRSHSIHESPEESTWTMYLQDFSMNDHAADDEDDDRSSFLSSDYENCSAVSDAGSSMTRKLSKGVGFGMDGSCNKSRSAVKRKTKQALLDDEALEDTASSPVCSPKVCHMIHSDNMKRPTLQTDNTDMRNYRTGQGTASFGQRQGSTSGGREVIERTELGFNVDPKSDCTELQKRGLCLVPFSTVANYFG